MNIEKNIFVSKNHGHSILMDIYFEQNGQSKPVIIFAHGFKGFKDWGHWSLLAEHFAKAGFVFIKFNFSHNGTTPEDLLAFGDLEAFGANNYQIELEDLNKVLDKVSEYAQTHPELDIERLALIGHSRGGGIGIVKTAIDARIKLLVCWASVSRLDYAWDNRELLESWKKNGVFYMLNGRTKQQMPIYYQLYENFKAHEELLNIEQQLKKIDKSILILHGTEDPAVPSFAAQQLQEWNPNAQLHFIEGANHVFGGKHPYLEDDLPVHSIALLEKTCAFLTQKFKD